MWNSVVQKTKRKIYDTWDISPVTGLQKQPDGSWKAPEKSVNKKDENTEKETVKENVTETEKDFDDLPTEERIEKREKTLNEFKSLDINKDSEKMLFKLGELNSMAGKLGSHSDLDNEIYSIKNETLPELAKVLKNKGYSVKIGDDYVTYDNTKDNVIYFEKDGVQVSFHGRFKDIADKYEHAKEGEWNGLYNSWKYTTKEEQKVAKEKQDEVEADNKKRLGDFSKTARDLISNIAKKKKIAIDTKDLEGIRIYPKTRYDNYNPYHLRKLINEKNLDITLPFKLQKALGDQVKLDVINKIKE